MKRPHFEILDYQDTPLGPLCLRRRELLSQPGTFVTEVTLNHEFLMSSYNTDSERAISNRSVAIHGEQNRRSNQPSRSNQSLRSLVGGFGLGYTAYELLKHDCVSSVEVVEYLPAVLGWLNDGLIPLAAELGDEPRLKLSTGDVYQRLLGEPSGKFDLIVIDVDHSPSDQLGSEQHAFYTAAGLRSAQRHLAEGGVLAVWSYAQNSEFSEALHQTFDTVFVEPVRTFNSLVDHEQTDWLFFAVSL